MQVRPDVLGVRAERQRIEVEVGSLIVEVQEGMGYPNVDPHPHVVGPQVEGPVVELYGLFSPTQMRQSGPHLVHEEVVSRIEVEGLVEELN